MSAVDLSVEQMPPTEQITDFTPRMQQGKQTQFLGQTDSPSFGTILTSAHEIKSLRPNFEKRAVLSYHKTPYVSAYINFNVYNFTKKTPRPPPIFQLCVNAICFKMRTKEIKCRDGCFISNFKKVIFKN